MIAIVSRIKSIIARHWFVLIALLILGVLFVWRTGNNGFLDSGDLGLSVNPLREITRDVYVWDSWTASGPRAMGIGNLPQDVLLTFFSSFLGNSLAQRALLVSIIFFAGVCQYAFILNITKRRLPAMVSAFIYAFNPWFALRLTGHIPLSIGYAFMPLAFLLFLGLYK